VIDYETYAKIRSWHAEGANYGQIAEKLSLDPRTVAFWANEKKWRQRKGPKRPSKLDPFKNDIERMLEKFPYSAEQVFRSIRRDGFDGGYTIVKEHVRKTRPPRTKAYLKLNFAPGECAQVDWGSFGSVPVGSTVRRLSFFVMVLCHSRMMYVEFTVSQTMEHFLACHQNALLFFGGVPEKIMLDNLKSAVLKRAVGQAPVFNPRYMDFAEHHGFSPVACNVGKGNEKGRVESGVGYVKKNLLAGLDVADFRTMKPTADNWLDTVANVRVHRETGKKPAELFEEEKQALKPLPANPCDVGVVGQARASSQFRVTVDANRYSVPAQLAGAPVVVKRYPDRICVYHDEKLVARHVRSYDRRRDFEDPDHPRALLQQRKKACEQQTLMRFMALSDKARDYWEQLAQRRMNPLHHVRKIVALSEIYSEDQVRRAIEDAFVFHAFSCEYIANILEQRARRLPEPGALHLTRREDLLELAVSEPDMEIYNKKIEEERK
jgi:transposase